jgi:hypothetical protein
MIKMVRKSLAKSISNQFLWIEKEKKTMNFFKLHHTNLCGPMFMASIDGSLYIVLLKDNHNSFHVTYCVKHKNDTLKFFEIIETL